METSNSIVITKKSNGNVLVTPEGTPYTVQSNSLISKGLNSVTVRQVFSPSSTIEFRVESVEKVVSPEGGEVFISDVDTLFSELNNFFFFEPVGASSGGGGLPDNYRVVAGVLRNTGSGWFVIDDIDHEPINIDSVTNTGSSIIVDYSSLNATKVISLAVTPDETYAGTYDFGSSVGLSTSTILIKQRKKEIINGVVTHTGNGNFTKSGNITSVSYNNTTGELTINHPTANATDYTFTDLPSAEVNYTRYQPSVFSVGVTSTKVKLYNLDGTQKDLLNPEISRFYFNRELESRDLTVGGINPNSVTNSQGNIWVVGIMKI